MGVASLLHGLVHGNLLAVPIFLDLPWRTEFAAGDVTLGLLGAAAYACFGLGSVPFGHFADRHGAPRLLVICVAGIGVSLALVAASPGIEALGASLALLGLFSGSYHPTGLSLISRAVREPGRGMGWHGMGGSLGIALGPATVGGLLQVGWHWRTVAAVLVVPAIGALAVLLASRLQDRVRPSESRPFRASLRGLPTGGSSSSCLCTPSRGSRTGAVSRSSRGSSTRDRTSCCSPSARSARSPPVTWRIARAPRGSSSP